MLFGTMLFEVLKQIGVDWKDRRLIMNLNMQQTAVVRKKKGDVDEGVRVGGELLKDVKFAGYQGMVAQMERAYKQS